jgi:hypothetical protein
LGCRGAVEKKTVLENLDLVLLAMDETVDKGYSNAGLDLLQRIWEVNIWLPRWKCVG